MQFSKQKQLDTIKCLFFWHFRAVSAIMSHKLIKDDQDNNLTLSNSNWFSKGAEPPTVPHKRKASLKTYQKARLGDGLFKM